MKKYLRSLGNLGYISAMTHHTDSGRIVINVPPELKRRLYAALALSGSTLKEWFERTAEGFCEDMQQTPSYYSSRPKADSGKRTQSVAEEPEVYRATDDSSKGKNGTQKKYTIASLFSGCGGMDLGFRGGFSVFGRKYRRLPFKTIWANDLNGEACKTYRLNLGFEVHEGDICSLIDSIPVGVDVLTGGFPCQDISVNGKRAGVNGARSGLYRAMIDAIARVKPSVFVAENVGALLRHQSWLEQVLRDFHTLGYTVHYQRYQAADFGVPQTRERVFFIGTAPGIVPFNPPTPERNSTTWMTALEAIGDLESLPLAPEFNHIWSHAKRSPEQGNRKLLPNRPGYTIRAECHGNIQFHYSLPRRMSMREAARLQSFPDDFIFASGLREVERQVGNAVPPVLAWHVANSVLRCLKGQSEES